MHDDKQRSLDPFTLAEAKNILEHYFNSPLSLKESCFLSEPGRRNILVRLSLKGPPQVPKSTILKRSLLIPGDGEDKRAFETFSRDWAGLEFLNQVSDKVHTFPKFYGGNKAHRFILIQDLGEKDVSLVDSLTTYGRDKAIAALHRFVKSLGRFHAASFGKLGKYKEILECVSPNAETLENNFKNTVGEVVDTLENVQHRYDLKLTDNVKKEAESVLQSLFLSNPFLVLTHGDICPDNVFYYEGSPELQLIDFEWSRPRSALLDGTYLRMGMPTCWCAKAIPNDIIESLEQTYRNELQRNIPAARDDRLYQEGYTNACAFWMLRSLMFLEDICEEEQVWPSGPIPVGSQWKAEENFVRPRFIARLTSFLEVSEKYGSLPHLREMCFKVLEFTKLKWPNVKPFALYPVFQDF